MTGPDQSKPAAPPVPAVQKSSAAWFRRVRTIRDAPSYAEGLVFGCGCVGLVLLLWWFLTRGEDPIISPAVMPSPGDTFASFASLWFDRGLSRSAIISLARVSGGFLLAAGIGVPLGIIAGSYLRVNAFFRPLTIFGRSVPVAALLPLAMAWFKIGEFSKVMFVFMATVAFVLFDSVTAAQNVHDRFIDTAYTLGAHGSRKKGARIASLAGLAYGIILMTGWYWLKEESERGSFSEEFFTMDSLLRFTVGLAAGFLLWYPIAGHQVMRKVVLPMALPEIVNSLRLTFGLAFGYIMLAEMNNATSGLGHLINMSQRRGFDEHMYLCLFIIAFLAWGIDRLIIMLQRHLFPHLKHGQA